MQGSCSISSQQARIQRYAAAGDVLSFFYRRTDPDLFGALEGSLPAQRTGLAAGAVRLSANGSLGGSPSMPFAGQNANPATLRFLSDQGSLPASGSLHTIYLQISYVYLTKLQLNLSKLAM